MPGEVVVVNDQESSAHAPCDGTARLGSRHGEQDFTACTLALNR